MSDKEKKPKKEGNNIGDSIVKGIIGMSGLVFIGDKIYKHRNLLKKGIKNVTKWISEQLFETETENEKIQYIPQSNYVPNNNHIVVYNDMNRRTYPRDTKCIKNDEDGVEKHLRETDNK